jgi:acyl-CoA thioesterase-2
MYTVSDILNTLEVNQLEACVFEASSFKTPWGRVYGGQALAQALQAAYNTVPEDRYCHSLHGYFILAGKDDMPIRYEVDEIRNGGSFTTRRVVAKQGDNAIFNLSASFSTKRTGFEHQFEMPESVDPDELMTDAEYNLRYKESHPEIYNRMKFVWPIEMKRHSHTDLLNPQNAEPKRSIWTKIKGDIPEDLRKQHILLTFISDYNIMSTGIMPNRKNFSFEEYFMTSLDHAMWFHRDFDLKDWVLYDLDSPSSFGGRTLGRGTYYDRNGTLIASVAQEGLIIKRKK